MSLRTRSDVPAASTGGPGPWVVETPRPTATTSVVVTCGACQSRQHASGRALGYTCETCGSRGGCCGAAGCRKASVVLAGVSACPRCGHDHQRASGGGSAQRPHGSPSPSRSACGWAA